MQIIYETSLKDFEAWSGAAETIAALTEEQLDTLTQVFEDTYPDGIDEGDLNDILWFEDDWIAEILGFPDFETLCRHNKGLDSEEDESEDDNYDEENEEDEEKSDDELVPCDEETDLWLSKNTGTPITLSKCPDCGLYYKPSLGHNCKRRRSDAYET